MAARSAELRRLSIRSRACHQRESRTRAASRDGSRLQFRIRGSENFLFCQKVAAPLQQQLKDVERTRAQGNLNKAAMFGLSE